MMVNAVTDERRKKAKPAMQDRVRYEVYGMPVEEIIASAVATGQPEEPIETTAEPEPAWPSLDDLKAGRATRRVGRRGR
jgi:hypothetical protein